MGTKGVLDLRFFVITKKNQVKDEYIYYYKHLYIKNFIVIELLLKMPSFFLSSKKSFRRFSNQQHLF